MIADAKARERIRTAHTDSLFVEAGAGTGKTTALVARVVDMVATGHLADVAGLAAISFTENAAADLRTRIRQGLEDGARGHHRGVDYSEEQQGRCRSAVGRLDDAVITTLHGFAARILAEAPLEAGLPPGFAVAEGLASAPASELAWRSFLDDLLDNAHLERHVVCGLLLGLKLGDLRPVADALGRAYELLEEGAFIHWPLPDISAEAVVLELHAALNDLPSWPEGDKLTEHLRTVVLPAFEELSSLRHPDDVLEALVRWERIACKQGQAAAWVKAGLDKSVVVDALSRAQQARDALLGQVGNAVALTLSAAITTWVFEQAERRQAEGVLEYHDLLVLARRLLVHHPEVRQRLHAQWPVLLIDEFQDTDPLQVEIAYLLAGRDDTGYDWSTAEVHGGGVFFVGDGKQSIYRFRRADVRLFAAVGDKHRDGRTALSVNFRSVGRILRAANHAFRSLIGGDPQQAALGYSDLELHRPDPDTGTHVLLLGGPHDDEGGAVELRQREALHLADVICRAHGTWDVEVERHGADGTTQTETVKASYRDMAVLLPTRTSLPALERALQSREVPYRIESRSLVWSTDAVRDLVTLLQAVDDPADEIALLAALRHPGLACSDRDLLTWRAAGGRWSLFADLPDGVVEDHPVPTALRQLREWHDQRWWLPVNELVEQVVRELRLVELTASQRRPRDHWRRLRFVVDQARAWCDAGGSGLGGFTAWAARQVDSDVDVLETVVPEPDDDAVRILTVHGAKGLEFPIVLVSGLSTTKGVQPSVVWQGTTPCVRFRKGIELLNWSEAVDHDKEQERQEAIRLLYVALTRAKDHLVIGCTHKPPKSEKAQRSAAQQLWELLTAEPGLVTTETDLPAAVDAPVTAATQPALDPSVRDTFAADRQVLLDQVSARVATSPTSLRTSADEPVKESQDEPGSPRRRTSRQGAAIGTAVHRVLELVDLDASDDDELHRLAVLACVESDIEPLVADVAARARTAMSAEVVRQAARRWREVYVVVRDGERYVEGYVDLLAELQDGSLAVVDYKTDRVDSPEDVAAKQALYGPQLEAYATAVERATGRRPDRTGLVFARAATTTGES